MSKKILRYARLPKNIEKLNQSNLIYRYKKEPQMIKGMKTPKARLPMLHAVCLGDVGNGEIMFILFLLTI